MGTAGGGAGGRAASPVQGFTGGMSGATLAPWSVPQTCAGARRHGGVGALLLSNLDGSDRSPLPAKGPSALRRPPQRQGGTRVACASTLPLEVSEAPTRKHPKNRGGGEGGFVVLCVDGVAVVGLCRCWCVALVRSFVRSSLRPPTPRGAGRSRLGGTAASGLCSTELRRGGATSTPAAGPSDGASGCRRRTAAATAARRADHEQRWLMVRGGGEHGRSNRRSAEEDSSPEIVD